MGKSKSPPKPPVISIPQPSADEKQLMAQQIALINQLTQQSDIQFQQAGADRDTAFNYLDKLTQPRELSDVENQLADKLSQAYFDQALSGITSGANKELFDTSRKDTIGGLLNSGLTNSSTATELLGNLEKEKLRLIAEAATQAGTNKLGLQKDFLEKGLARDADIFSTLYSGGRQGGALASQLANSAFGGAGQAQTKLASDRLNAFNVATQNAQAQYGYQLDQFNRNQTQRKGLGGLAGGLLGAGAGALLAIPTGGLSLAMGAGLGGTLGYGLGSSFL